MIELMTAKDVAGYLQVSKKTVYRLLRRGDIPAIRIGRQLRFDKASIDEWLYQKSIVGQANILIVDDEEIVRALFRETLERLGYVVITAKDGSEGLKLVRERDLVLVFLDLKMPGMDGAELFQHIKAIKPNLPVVIITAYPNSDMMAQALAYGPFGIMNKPFGESDIVTATNAFLQAGQRERRLATHQERER